MSAIDRERLDRIALLAGRAGRDVRLMEVCGTHTMAAFRAGLRHLLPEGVRLLSGPGCPVCVTGAGYIDAAVELARRPGVVVATFGDLVRVPGSATSLEEERARGGAVRAVYSPMDALEMARAQSGAQVVFLGVGFETTVPVVAWTIRKAREDGVSNYSVLCAHKTMPRAMETLVRDPELRIDGFLCPGHVSVVTGSRIYEPIAADCARPCVVAGFEPDDILESIEMLLRQIVEGRSEVEIQYARAVDRDGNRAAQALIDEVFEPADDEWRGLGTIPGSGLRIRGRFAAQDAVRSLGVNIPHGTTHPLCRCGEVLRGRTSPIECRLFATVCTPLRPYGACMVSSEGTCAAWYKYARRRRAAEGTAREPAPKDVARP